jgi:putative transposase
LDCQARRWRRAPVAKPEPWHEWVDRLETEAELTALRRSMARGVPFGAGSWQRQTAKRLGLESSLRPVGRPPKSEKVPE